MKMLFSKMLIRMLVMKKWHCIKCPYALGTMTFITCPCLQCKEYGKIKVTLGSKYEPTEIQVTRPKSKRISNKEDSNHEN